MEEPILNDRDWQEQIKQAMREIRRGEYRRRQAMAKRDANPWIC